MAVSPDVSLKPTDRVLVRRAVMGDREAFADLFDRHSEATYRYVLHMLDGDEHEARDVAQEVWVQAWQKLGTFRGESQLRTWLLSIAGRKALDHRRRRRPVPVDDTLLDARVAQAGDAESEFAGSALWEVLTTVLSELPWRQKAVWLLRELEEMSYEEIAEVLGTSTTVVRGQLHRARRTVAVRMEQWR